MKDRKDPHTYLDELKAKGLDPEREARFREELSASPGTPSDSRSGPFPGFARNVYAWHDMAEIMGQERVPNPYQLHMKALDDLLERDRQREKDGFPRKIRVGRLIKPGKGGKGKIVVVPSTEEEKFVHDPTIRPPGEGGATGGSGKGEEGEVIGEQKVRDTGEEPGQGPGQGEGEAHEMGASAYELGKVLTEQFQLPNLKEKGKKRSFTRYVYELTDRNRGSGQVLDKKATLRKIVETNISLGNIPDPGAMDPTRFLISPRDKVYRIFSQEKDYEPQAMVFFLRDYSGSMAGKVTDLVATQHVMIYSWLLYQYAGQVESRFILHDTEAKEVPDFDTYYNSRVAGGTEVASAYKLVNEIVQNENLAADYNIYVFHGTDGDDWDTGGDKAIPELVRILSYVSRMGVTIAEHAGTQWTEVARYLENSGLLRDKPDLLRLDVMHEDAEESRIIDGIKKLIS